MNTATERAQRADQGPETRDQGQSTEVRDALIAKVEAALVERLKMFDRRPGTVGALKIESDFMSGAMVAINALLPNEENANAISSSIPPRWVIALMTGRSVLKKL